MKKMMFVAMMMAGVFGSMAQETAKVEKKETTVAKEAYQCPMKCEGTKTYAKKGKCPSCGMELKLVKK